MKDLTWKDLDDIVQMKNDKSGVCLSILEHAIATEDTSVINSIVSALRGPSGTFTARVYPLSGIRITIDLQKRRLTNWHAEGKLLENLYEQARLAEKSLKEDEEKIKKEKIKKEEMKFTAKGKRELEEAFKKVEDIDGGPVVSVEEVDEVEEVMMEQSKKRVPKSKTLPTINIRESIKFDKLERTEDYTAYIPAVDKLYEFPSFTTEFVKLLDHGMNVWLYGGTGSGKSSLVEQVCAVGGIPMIYMGLHEDSKPDQLFGGYKLVDGNTIWQDGPVTKAYREGLVLLLDELDAGLPEILFSLFAILDGKALVLADNGSEIVSKHKNFRIVATGNTLGRGDDTGMYNGTNIMNRALLNRFRVWYEVQYPSRDTYEKIIMSEGVTQEIAEPIAALAEEVNEGYKSGTLTESFSLRDAREVGRVAELVGSVKRALQITLLARLSSVEAAAVNEVFRRKCPGIK